MSTAASRIPAILAVILFTIVIGVQLKSLLDGLLASIRLLP